MLIMKYPMINKQPRREVNVPELSGGLNLRDSLTGVRDNQMTGCVNMWYKDGMLRTRPNFVFEEGSTMIINNSSYELIAQKAHNDILNDGAVLISFKIKNTDNLKMTFQFYWLKENDHSRVGDITVDEESDYFVVEKNGILYCYLSNCSIYTLDYKNGEIIWQLVSDSDYYIPTIMAHCKATNNGLDYTGTMFEGYNLLTDSYKMIFSTVNLNDVEDGVTWMRYPYISKLPDGVETTIIARLTTKEGTVCEHKAVWTGGKELRCYEITDEEPKDKLYLYVTGYHVHFVTEKGTSNIATIKKEDFVEDNLEIEVIFPTDKTSGNLKKIFNMTKSVWFGGTANGINGGSRLFLCGNTSETEGALVIWSGLDNPLYFNENNYVYIGNKSHPVTAFGKQGENLIIFKANEMYYSYCAVNNDITADDLINQTVVDYEASSVYFPVIALHSSIGCDCPDSIQLCRNRLVWLNSNGKVYTLVSANQYSEMTVYTVSDLIEKKIKTYDAEALKAVTSQDFGGHYMVIINSEAYLMDYNSYGYTHIYSYSKTEDANLLIPWYYWSLLPEERFSEVGKPQYFAIGESIIAIYANKPKNIYQAAYSVLNAKNNTSADQFVLSYDADKNGIIETSLIGSTMYTKLFDFSAAGYLKNVDRVDIGFGNNGGVPVDITFVTDKGSENDTVTLVSGTTDERAAAFIRYKSFYPSIRALRTFGVKIECEGLLIVDRLSLQYRLLGGAK